MWIPSACFSPGDGFQQIDENLRATLGIFSQASEPDESYDGLEIHASGVDFAMFNVGVIASPVENSADLCRRVECVGALFARKGVPWSLWMCQDWLGRQARAIARETICTQGLHLVGDLPAMQADPVLPPRTSLPQLEIRAVADSPTRLAFTHVLSVCFGIPFVICREIYDAERTWLSGFTGYIGFLDGDPVCTAATRFAAGVVGVYSVATLPSYERRGYAEAITRFALKRAQAEYGIERTVLQSSEEGYNLYVRMGYKPVTRYSVYAFS